MSNLPSSGVPSLCPLSFLKQNPCLSDSLLADCNYDLDEVTAVLEPILEAPRRCRFTPLYIQAVSAGHTTFLATNLPQNQGTEVTAIAPCWLIGRSPVCAITTHHASVSRRHAVIGCHPAYGFYVTDVGSSNGTWINNCPIAPTERRSLRDGDLLQLGRVQIEFFLTIWKKAAVNLDENTYS